MEAQLNRSQLLNAYAERNDMTRREADAAVTSFLDLITETVARGEDVAISGFAKFRRIDRPARMPLKAFKDAVLTGKTPAKKAPAKKTVAKKAPAKKAPAKKAVAKKAPAKKAPAKKTAKRR